MVGAAFSYLPEKGFLLSRHFLMRGSCNLIVVRFGEFIAPLSLLLLLLLQPQLLLPAAVAGQELGFGTNVP